jgi:hypothetical protein
MKPRMGTFYTNCRVANHTDRKKSVEIPKLLVDTDSELFRRHAQPIPSLPRFSYPHGLAASVIRGSL